MKIIFKFIKSLFKIAIWLILLALLLVVILYLSAGKIVQHFAPDFISKITQTETTLGDVDISLFSGRVGFNNLLIRNPAGFKNKNVFELGKLSVEFDPRSVLTDKVIIRKVQISGLNVSAETSGTTGETNVVRIQNNVKKFFAEDSVKEAKQEKVEKTAKTGASGTQKAVVVKELILDKSSASGYVLVPVVGAIGATIPLPDIHMQNIGEDKRQTFEDVALIIFNAVDSEIADSSKKAIQQAMEDAQKKVKDAANDKIKSVTGGAISDGIDAIKNLF